MAFKNPILVGVGEVSERIDDSDYKARSPVELATCAARSALYDAGIADTQFDHVDTLAAIRTFDDLSPWLRGAFGHSSAFPLSIANALGINPKHPILAVGGGQSPQQLVNDSFERVSRGDSGLCLLVGAEAISTLRWLQQQGESRDWSDHPDGTFEDRGAEFGGVITRELWRHYVLATPPAYGLCENARRARLGLSPEDYRQSMAKLFAPFSQIASKNAHAMSHKTWTLSQLAKIDSDNRLIADPYPRRLIARDQVNQGAAVVITSEDYARKLGIPQEKWVYLHGYSDLCERNILERQDLGTSPAAILATQLALKSAQITIKNLGFFDLYSCYPIAVFNLTDAFDLPSDGSRPLSITGGLPFFGGAGNNYSMHAIAQMARILRKETDQFGYVGANGGVLSKYSAGIYSCRPTKFRLTDSSDAQNDIDRRPAPPGLSSPNTEGRIETYTILFSKRRPPIITIIGRDGSQRRFVAAQPLTTSDCNEKWLHFDLLGKNIRVKTTPRGNRFTFV